MPGGPPPMPGGGPPMPGMHGGTTMPGGGPPIPGGDWPMLVDMLNICCICSKDMGVGAPIESMLL